MKLVLVEQSIALLWSAKLIYLNLVWVFLCCIQCINIINLSNQKSYFINRTKCIADCRLVRVTQRNGVVHLGTFQDSEEL